ncbi:hypothetical protein JTB14_030934 [Gonioctena quinquepunctata]|nr:hypothetical protein JTB14_030934 [Gonioctena quinquepunctata]
MSNFFSNLFSSKKPKKTKNVSNPVQQDSGVGTDDTIQDLPIMIRRCSLSKSGRMKERKRAKAYRTISSEPSPEKIQSGENMDQSDLPDKEIFDTQGIIEQIRAKEDKVEA